MCVIVIISHAQCRIVSAYYNYKHNGSIPETHLRVTGSTCAGSLPGRTKGQLAEHCSMLVRQPSRSVGGNNVEHQGIAVGSSLPCACATAK